MTRTQERLVSLMRKGHRLWWYGDNGPELEEFSFWPQKRTVRALLSQGILEWAEYANKNQREAGICEIQLAGTIRLATR